MRCLVTGAAGFIGSHLCDALLARGDSVTGIDAFIDYYPRAIKERNLSRASAHRNFTFHELDLRFDDLRRSLDGIEVVFHLAAMGGLVRSWTDFDRYMTCNIQATQRILEAAKAAGTVRQFIAASTSSVYGRDVTGPETTSPQPISPYGVTKLAAEYLIQAYGEQYGLPTTILRYFSVYGPRQRPDMGYHIFIDRLLANQPITVFGDGNQLRGNTHIADIVRATILAQERFMHSAIFNIGGAEEVSANQVISILEEIIGAQAILTHEPARPGEQRRALADTDRARQQLDFTPTTPLRDGLAAQVAWQRALRDAARANGGVALGAMAGDPVRDRGRELASSTNA